jgi:protein-S-isoprenylcysteine O-methyltransferase Ste14
MRGISALLRSAVWLGGAGFYGYLKQPAGGGILATRADGAGLALHCWSNVVLARSESGPVQTPAALAVTGPFRFVRNPIYLAGIALLAGIGLLYAPWRAADLAMPAVLLVFFHLRVVRVEEPTLRNRFGAAYDDYCRRVPRWLPRFGTERVSQHTTTRRS